MAIPDVKQALRTWLMDATGLPDGRVIFDQQKAPRPKAPYITLNPRLALAKIGSYDEERATADADVVERCGQRRLTVSVNAYGADALERLEAALDGLEAEAIHTALYAAGLSFVEHTEARDVGELLDTKFEDRAQADVFFHVASSRTDEVGHIATVEGAADVGDASWPYTIPE